VEELAEKRVIANFMLDLRLSDFSVCIPVNEAGLTLAVNTCWGTSVAISNETATQLTTHGIQGLSTTTIGTLIQHCILTSQTPAQERKIFRQVIVERGKRALSADVRAYLMPSYDCNLKCVYCFQHKIRWAMPLTRMSEQTALAAFRYLEAMFHEGTPRGITLYGGEPLGPDNRPIVEFICSESRRRQFSLMSATHGWNLDQYFDLLGPKNISVLHVTVDGPQSTHDRRRIGPHRGATFERIMAHIEMALSRETRIRMRVNVDAGVLDRLAEFGSYLEARGLLANPLFSVYVAPMFATKSQLNSARAEKTATLITESALAKKLGEHPDLARTFGGHPPVYDRIAALVTGSLPAPAAGHCCYGTRTIVLDPAGSIYSCVFLAGEREYAVGCYLHSKHKVSNDTSEWIDQGTRRCAVTECKYALYCGAGSPYDSFARHGTTISSSCNCSDFESTFAGYVSAAYVKALSEGELSDHASA
jgi:uncharacterized protein